MLNRFLFLAAVIVLAPAAFLTAGVFPVDFQAAVRLSRTDAAKAEAVTAYRKAATVPGVSDYLGRTIEKKLSTLQP